jgi:hypothetical protein
MCIINCVSIIEFMCFRDGIMLRKGFGGGRNPYNDVAKPKGDKRAMSNVAFRRRDVSFIGVPYYTGAKTISWV